MKIEDLYEITAMIGSRCLSRLELRICGDCHHTSQVRWTQRYNEAPLPPESPTCQNCGSLNLRALK